MATHGHAPSTELLCPPQGVCVYHREPVSTTGHVCLLHGMFVYHMARLSITGHVCLPKGMFFHNRECLSTTGHACLPQGMCCACGVAVHVDPPAALSSCQKKTSVDRDSRNCLLWAVSGSSLACWDPPSLPISRYTCCSATSSCSSWGSSRTWRVCRQQSADSFICSFVLVFIHSVVQSLVLLTLY